MLRTKENAQSSESNTEYYTNINPFCGISTVGLAVTWGTCNTFDRLGCGVKLAATVRAENVRNYQNCEKRPNPRSKSVQMQYLRS